VELRDSSRFGEQDALCPVHGERRPSLRVNLEKGLLFCQACGFKGTAMHLVMAMESCDKAEALKRLEPILRNAGVEMKQSVRSRYQRPGEGRAAATGRVYVPPGRR
jgi:DNA primase